MSRVFVVGDWTLAEELCPGTQASRENVVLAVQRDGPFLIAAPFHSHQQPVVFCLRRRLGFSLERPTIKFIGKNYSTSTLSSIGYIPPFCANAIFELCRRYRGRRCSEIDPGQCGVT